MALSKKSIYRMVIALVGAAIAVFAGVSILTASSDHWTEHAQVDWYNEDYNTFTIDSVEKLAGIAKLVNDGVTADGKNIDGFRGKILTVTGNLNLSAYTWVPIGTDEKPFRGTLVAESANIFAIEGMNLGSNNVYAGLVGYMDGGTVGGFHFANGSININTVTQSTYSSAYAGAAVGKMVNNGIVYNITNTIPVKLNAAGQRAYAGGIVGAGEGSISNSTNDTLVEVSGAYAYAGGITGSASNGGLIIKKATNNGTIHSGNGGALEVYAGGIAGHASGTLLMEDQATPIINTASVTASSGELSYAGGIVGKAGAEVRFSNETVNNGAVKVDASGAKGSYAGGMAGAITAQQNQTIFNIALENTAPIVNIGGTNVNTGGIVGYINGSFTWNKSYSNHVAITSSGSANVYTGGLIGNISGDLRFNGAAHNTAEVWVSGNPNEAYSGGLVGYAGSRVQLESTGEGDYSNSGKMTVLGGTGVYTGGIVSNRGYAKVSGEPSVNVLSLANIEVNGAAKLYTGGFVGMASEGSHRTFLKAVFAQEIKVTTVSSSAEQAVRTGGIVGYIVNGIIDKSSFHGKLEVTGGDHVYTGGIAGVFNGGSLSEVYAGNALSSFAQISTDGVAGGIVGDLKGTIEGATVKTLALEVNSAGGTAGGVAGKAQGLITDANVGLVDERNGDSVLIKAAVRNAVGNVDNITAGGIVGTNAGLLTVVNSHVAQIGLLGEVGRSSYALGAVAGLLTAEATIGEDDTAIQVERMLFNVQGEKSNVGGAIGINYAPKVSVKVKDIQFNVPASSVNAGAIAGVNNAAIQAESSILWAEGIEFTAQGNDAHLGGLYGEHAGHASLGRSENITITASGTGNELGGIAGRNTGTLIDNGSFNPVIQASGANTSAGGITGHSIGAENGAAALISYVEVYAEGEPMITASGANSNIGGIVGQASRTDLIDAIVGTEIPQYAMLSVKGSGVAVGGIAGRIELGKIKGDAVKTNIKNLVISTTTAATNGYFGGIAGYAKDTLLDSLVTSKTNLTINGDHAVVGGAAGYNRSTNTAIITNVYAEDMNLKVNATASASIAGGFVGLNDARANEVGTDPATAVSTIQKSRFVGVVNIAAPSTVTGGWVGENRSLIANNSIADKIPVNFKANNGVIGGLVGLNHASGTLYYTYSNANLKIEGENALVGGLVGENAGHVIASYFDTDVTTLAHGTAARSLVLGGLVGRNTGEITKSYSVANVTATGAYSYAGGLVGEHAAGYITDSYTAKEVKATNANSFAGGFIGRITGGKVTTSYSAVQVSASNGAFAGGFAGRYDNASKELLYKSFYVKDEDHNINKDLPDFADGNHRFLNVHARLSTILEATLRDREVFPGLSGWDFNESWKYGSLNASYKYPELNRSANNDGGGSNDVNANIRWYMLDKDALFYDIGTEAELAGLAAIVNGTIPGLEKFNFEDRTIRLLNPIHIQSKQWTSIGKDENHAFEGEFEGKNYLIDGLTVGSSQDYAGLFGVIGTNGQVSNIVMEPASIAGSRFTGALAGMNKGSVSNVTITLLDHANVTGGIVGGIIGRNSGTYADLTISLKDASFIEGTGAQPIVGGIIGDNSGAYEAQVLNLQGGSIGSSENDAIIGGLIGRQAGDVGKLEFAVHASSRIYATGERSIVGGVIGNHVSGKVENMTVSISDGKLEATGKDSILGGVIGRSDANSPLLRMADAGSTLRQIKIIGSGEGPHLYGAGTVGGVIGAKTGSGNSNFDIEDVSTENVVIATKASSEAVVVGGIAGKLTDTAIARPVFRGVIHGAGNSVTAGGIVGYAQNAIIMKADVKPDFAFTTGQGESAIGGIAGVSASTDRDKPYSFGSLIPFYHGIYDAKVQGGKALLVEAAHSTDLFVGGIAGKNSNASIYQSKEIVDLGVNGGKAVAIGGLTGFNDGIIVSSDAQSNIHAEAGSIYSVGGVAGISAGGEIHYSKAVSPNGEKIVLGTAVTQPNVVPSTHVGGFVGLADYTRITNSTTNVAVEVNCTNPDNTIYAGGFAGLLGDSDTREALIQWAYATGNVNVTGWTGAYAGGFAGSVDHYLISDAYASGSVQASGFDTRSGGFAAAVERNATISRAYAVAPSIKTTGTNGATRSYTGGFAGYNDGTLKQVYADAASITVQASGANVHTGAFIGYNFRDGKVEQSSYKGTLIAIGRNLGAGAALEQADLTAGLGLGDWDFEVDTTFLSDQSAGEAVIRTVKQLQGIVLLMNDTGLDYYRLYDRAAAAKPSFTKIMLAADLDLTSKKMTPFTRFGSELDGQGHTIKGLKLAAGDTGTIGFVIENEGHIHHLTFVDANVEGGESAGIVAGINRASGTIENVSVSGAVRGTANVGGVTGINEGKINKTIISGSIGSLASGSTTALGGITGQNKAGAAITEAFSLADIHAVSSQAAAGGIAGIQLGLIDNAYNAGRVISEGTGKAWAGGIAGHAQSGMISHSLNTGEIKAAVEGKLISGNTFFGGIAGQKDNSASLAQNVFNKQMLKLNVAYYDAAGNRTAGQAAEAAGVISQELVKATLPSQLSSSVWQALQGFYPRLQAFENSDTAVLGTAAVILGERDSINRIKSAFELTTDGAVKWTAKLGEATITSVAGKLKGTLTKTGPVEFIVAVNGQSRSVVLGAPSVPFAEAALAPKVVSGEVSFSDKVSVELASDEPRGVIYYTVDGTEPDEHSQLYTAPIELTATTTIKAITVVDGKEYSAILSGVWTKQVVFSGGGGGAAPVVTQPAVTAQIGQKSVDAEAGTPVTVARNSKLVLTAPTGQVIYYTTDGSAPTTKSLQYKGPILITGNMTIKAITDKNEEVVTIAYKVENAKYELKSDANKTPYITGYSNDLFKPNTALTRYELIKSLSLLLDMEQVSVGSLFSDVSAGEEELVAFFTSAGIVEGYPNGTFRSDRGLTRAEFVVIMSRVLNLSIAQQGAASLSDVKGHWSEKYINAFTSAGYVKGFPNGTFRPNDEISRAQAVVLINRVIKAQKQGETNAAYKDLPATHWAYEEIMSALIK
ncbi:chitobiase/beta-hexosaminidase C-terminal domain-containing protein [Paenibacillus luteus]|uniref:chitobiase/beta-hexosaminidase C-terminal domain-containing protein n=1 Tax=Paenibacillus luteus TaxID=2545753 RepID=UPI00114431CC|nr:chitobiase/beta-hexosaminidase C-terminal domain-containing protein [Paenibacillus luteus]